MDVKRKKVLVVTFDDLVHTASGKDQPEDITDFRISKEFCDRVRMLKNISKIIVHGSDEPMAVVKAMEFFVFVYCKTAVAMVSDLGTIDDSLPYNFRKRELLLSVGDVDAAAQLKIDFLNINDFL